MVRCQNSGCPGEGARGVDSTRAAETGGLGRWVGGGGGAGEQGHGRLSSEGPHLGGQQPSDSGGIWSMRSRCSCHGEGSAGQTWARDRGSEKRWVQAHPGTHMAQTDGPTPTGIRAMGAERRLRGGGDTRPQGLPHGHPATDAMRGLPSDTEKHGAGRGRGPAL